MLSDRRATAIRNLSDAVQDFFRAVRTLHLDEATAVREAIDQFLEPAWRDSPRHYAKLVVEVWGFKRAATMLVDRIAKGEVEGCYIRYQPGYSALLESTERMSAPLVAMPREVWEAAQTWLPSISSEDCLGDEMNRRRTRRFGYYISSSLKLQGQQGPSFTYGQRTRAAAIQGLIDNLDRKAETQGSWTWIHELLARWGEQRTGKNVVTAPPGG